MRQFSALRPQDVLVLLKLVLLTENEWKQLDLVNTLGISPSEISHSLERLRLSRLANEKKRKALRANALEFLLYGVKYSFPAKFGPMELGVVTAHSAPPLNSRIQSIEKIVWPHPKGNVRGQALYPIYPSAVEAAMRDPELHEMLALLDALRIGRARERKIATQELEKRLS
jgi:DNA-binding Xre family transcriptional regulator